MKCFFPVLRQIRTSQELSLKPLPFTSAQINTDRHSTVAAGELEDKESLRLQSSSHTRPFLATEGRTGKTRLRILLVTEMCLHLCIAFLPWRLCMGRRSDKPRGTPG